MELTLRPAVPADLDDVLRLFDEAIAWLAARGRSAQWGTAPRSPDPAFRARIADQIGSGWVTVATRAAEVVAAISLDRSIPSYVPADLVPPGALYVHVLIGSRRPDGRGAGRRLLAYARAEAAGGPLAVDHWAGSPELDAVYGGAGYEPVGSFTVELPSGPWTGTVRVCP